MGTKVCTKCLEEKSLLLFNKHKLRQDGLQLTCRSCDRIIRREYIRTKRGKLWLIFSNQKRHSISRGHPEPSYTRIEFTEWALGLDSFNKLFDERVASGYKKEMSPSADRNNDYLPYTFDNITWMTWESNNRKAIRDKIEGRNNKNNKSVHKMSLDGTIIETYHSLNEAERRNPGARNSLISSCCTGKSKTHWKHKRCHA